MYIHRGGKIDVATMRNSRRERDSLAHPQT